MMGDFWSRKKDQLQKEGIIQTPRQPVTRSDGPWWAYSKTDPPEPQRQAQTHTEPTGPVCLNCGSGNFSKANSSTAARCFNCGYVDGRTLNEPNIPTGMVGGDAQTLKVRQIPSQAHFGRSVAEINQNLAVLEQSAQGKTTLA